MSTDPEAAVPTLPEARDLSMRRTYVEQELHHKAANRTRNDGWRYRFHCTNGSECVFDAKGTDIRIPRRLANRAQQVAREVMHTMMDRQDWSKWRVTVCALNGRPVL